MNKITKVILGAALVLVFIGAFSGAAVAVQPDEPGVIIITGNVASVLTYTPNDHILHDHILHDHILHDHRVYDHILH